MEKIRFRERAVCADNIAFDDVEFEETERQHTRKSKLYIE